MKKSNTFNLIILSLMHFLVDFICVSSLFLLYRDVYYLDYYPYIFLTYNLVAFLSQPFLGLFIDNINKPNKRFIYKTILCISSGILLIAWILTTILLNGYLYYLFFLFLIAIIYGIGNALFHVIGGKESLKYSNKASFGGLYVSTGALGVGLASSLYLYPPLNRDLLKFTFDFIPIIILVLTLLHSLNKYNLNDFAYTSYKYKSNKIYSLVVSFVCISIAVRSFLGFFSTLSSEISTFETFLLLYLATFIGKAIGGILLDLAGPYFTIGISSIISIVLSIFLQDNIIISYIFVLSFNLLMPVTLDLLRRYFVSYEGFAFGLSAALLVPGYLIAQLTKNIDYQFIIIPIICFITGAMLISVYIFNKKQGLNEGNNKINS